MKNDTDLRRDVIAELEWEPSIDAALIGVATHEGVVTLTGTARSIPTNWRPSRPPSDCEGVKAIANDLEVPRTATTSAPTPKSPRQPSTLFKWKTSVPVDEIKVAVSRGWITLEGEVDWQYQKDAAFRAVHLLFGVRGVTNLIAVKPQASATEVKSHIEAAFRRSAEMDAQNVQVEIQMAR